MDYGWQSDKETWERVPADLADGRSWRYVGFTELDAVSVPKGQSGIYVLCASPVGRRFRSPPSIGDLFGRLLTPFYIGQTTDLHTRFLRHCRDPSPRVHAATACFGQSLTFWFHRVPLDRLAHDEAVLIKCFGPPANGRQETIPAMAGQPVPIGTRAHSELPRTTRRSPL